MRGKVSHTMRLSSGHSEQRAYHPVREEGKRSPGKEGDLKGITCLGDIALLHTGESLGQRTPKDCSNSGSYNHRALCHQWSADVRLGLVRYAKHIGSKWLKIILLGLFLR